jgi:5'-deoxynucleotidase YfbR-like HD superfamily hydrolase
MDIEIEDIAHGLSFVARWNGQTFGKFPYSVAEHSVFVEKLFYKINPKIDTKWRLAALLHDAPEYVIGDMISPVKSSVGKGYGEMDERLTAAIHQKFGLPSKIPDVIKNRSNELIRHQHGSRQCKLLDLVKKKQILYLENQYFQI